MRKRPVIVYLPETILQDIDKIRGDVNRTRFIQRCCEERLSKEKTI